MQDKQPNLVCTTDRAPDNRALLPKLADQYELAHFHVDFTSCDSIESLVKGLRVLAKQSLHIIGPRGCVYDTNVIASNIEFLDKKQKELNNHKPPEVILFAITRSAGIRETAYKLMIGESSQSSQTEYSDTTSVDYLTMLREGGNVRRFHTSKLVTPQDNAQHSFNSALIIESMIHDYNKSSNTSINPLICIMHMLLHDVPEQAIGDIPGFTKTMYPEVKNIIDNAEAHWCSENFTIRHYDYMYSLSDLEKNVCSFVDRFECALKGKEEHQNGGKEGSRIFFGCINSCTRIAENIEDEVMAKIMKELLSQTQLVQETQ